jgi:hypothetical protein
MSSARTFDNFIISIFKPLKGLIKISLYGELCKLIVEINLKIDNLFIDFHVDQKKI